MWGIWESQSFSAKLWAEAQRRHWSSVREREAIGDGAPWI